MMIGIIGFGSFGKFLAEKLSSRAHVKVYDRRDRDMTWRASFEEVAQCDYVIPSVPIEAYDAVLAQLAQHMPSTSVLVDVCSVKERAVELIRAHLPDHTIVATHPLFGPESASVSLQGHTLVMCPEVSDEAQYSKVKACAQEAGLEVVEMSASEHDREMAVVQGLTFFIARTLDVMKVHDQRLSAPSFQRLLSLAELELHHSPELFRTIQQGNARTRDVRRQFLDAAVAIHNELEGKTR